MATETNKKRKVDNKCRRFQDKWKLEYFFTELRNSCVCLICRETVAVFEEFTIKRHYDMKHGNYNKLTGDKRGEKLKELEVALMSQQCFSTRARDSNDNATKASYKVALRMAKHSKPFTDGEIIKDCMMEAVEKICPEKKLEFAKVCLARNTLIQRIEDISSDIKRQLEAKAAQFDFFSLACNESMDASDTPQLLIFLRGVDDDMNVIEELLDLQKLEDQRRGIYLFFSVCSAIHNMKLQWNKVTGIITDDKQSGLSTLICNKVSEEGGKATKLHCIIHQHLLCVKHLKYDHVMQPLMKAIHYIHSKAQCHPQFQQFLLDIQAEYGDVVYHNEVRWLSWGSALQRFYSLREEIGQFLAEKGQPMPELSDPVWLADFGFLVDITQHLNVLNKSLQGRYAMVNQLYSHIKAFRTKLLLFQRHLSETRPNTTHFSSLQEIMTSFPENNMSAQIRRYEADISSLAEEFQHCLQEFADIEKEITLFSSPFSVAPIDAPDHLQLELIGLQCDLKCRSQYRHLPLVDFYRQLDKNRFREIRTFAKKMLSLFGSTYLVEKTFSIMNCVRTSLSDIQLCDILRIKTTVFEPDLAYIMQSRSQHYPSH